MAYFLIKIISSNGFRLKPVLFKAGKWLIIFYL